MKYLNQVLQRKIKKLLGAQPSFSFVRYHNKNIKAFQNIPSSDSIEDKQQNNEIKKVHESHDDD